ncbi:dolichyl-phosphate-mannose-protein mannosyltransferase family protein [Syntrophobotulus glycolicus DSM 8271]|uniref:Dolichyl-phosphate-mannose-protein mannosyltransferase family protein n=1 Tax=Syntrophobotulus glycolicus (strain DSM 8271 / FlGlyR) TaxID=645991 RepID=F0SUW8_SYNGF|nr:glycosyltransferase family 39 protein [Syntrophobotulus glycolicus]ADY56684.1 dolichyl-phosphate-mannose-protein mannosyltransferase family protein [Syntrophobotulus glycolicus DSM 8271]
MKLKHIRQNHLYLILIIFVYALLQFTAIYLYGDSWYLGNFETMNNDDVKYIRSAWTLLQDHRLVYHDVNEPTVFIMPGYPFVLAFFMKIFGYTAGLTAVRVFQGILQIVSLCIIYCICQELFNKKTAQTAITLYLLYFPNIVGAVLILTETVFTFLLILLVYISMKALQSKEKKYYLLGGTILGLAVLVRPTILLFPIVILVMWIYLNYSIKEMLARSLLVACLLIMVLSPWWIRNYLEFSRFIPLTASSGNPFLQGTFVHYDQSEGFIYDCPDDAIERDKSELEAGKQRLRENFRKNPVLYIYWYTLGKTVFLWAMPFYPFDLFGIPLAIMVICHVILLILAVRSMVRMLKSNDKNKLLLLLFGVIAYVNLVHLPYFTYSRYAYPVMSLIIIFAANTLTRVRINRGTGTAELTRN